MEHWELLAEGRIPRTYYPGQFVYIQGAQPDHFYYLQSGTARSFISLPDGEERVITVHRSGSIMGEASFFDQSPRVTSAVAISECKVIPFNRQQLDGIFARHPELALPMLQYLARTVRILSYHVNDSALPAEQRIVRFLLNQIQEPEGCIRCTHESIGQAVGVSRVTVSRTLSGLCRVGAIETGYGTIRIMDAIALKKHLSDD